ncbi:hypothetical protein B9Z55_018603 [Caenorhabditis nigoni]|uniref:Serpentine receptor class gamma n=1 Tax=Caenorhabditis nigoni TaxID=1611254 RepID=A0A2G5TEZ3_9PELO|nr:hypothetical protein B9Z55_018603 [Caenorhabditis nigoni]
MSDPKTVSEVLRQNIQCYSGEPDEIQYVKFAIQLSYLLPFGLLYISFLIKIARKKKDRDLFEDSFFSLQLADGIITLFFLVSDTVFIRLTSYVRPVCEIFVSLLKDPSYILTPYLTLHQYVQLAKMLSTVAMSLNRYTSIVNPVHHKTFWTQHCTKILIAVFTIPLLFVWPVAIGTTSFTPFGGTAIINYERVVPWARTTYVRLIVAVPSFCFTLYSSIVTSSKLRKLGGHMKKVEFSMNMATLFTACGFILVVAVQIAYLADSASNWVENMWLTKIILAATQVSYDFYMLSGPVVLLILDKRMRSSIICCSRKSRKLARKSGSKNTTTVVAVQPLPTITNHSGHSS